MILSKLLFWHWKFSCRSKLTWSCLMESTFTPDEAFSLAWLLVCSGKRRWKTRTEPVKHESIKVNWTPQAAVGVNRVWPHPISFDWLCETFSDIFDINNTDWTCHSRSEHVPSCPSCQRILMWEVTCDVRSHNRVQLYDISIDHQSVDTVLCIYTDIDKWIAWCHHRVLVLMVIWAASIWHWHFYITWDLWCPAYI